MSFSWELFESDQEIRIIHLYWPYRQTNTLPCSLFNHPFELIAKRSTFRGTKPLNSAKRFRTFHSAFLNNIAGRLYAHLVTPGCLYTHTHRKSKTFSYVYVECQFKIEVFVQAFTARQQSCRKVIVSLACVRPNCTGAPLLDIRSWTLPGWTSDLGTLPHWTSDRSPTSDIMWSSPETCSIQDPPPGERHAVGQADGTHPTGMLSSLFLKQYL